MKKTLILVAAILVAGVATAQTWKLDKSHSNLGFTVSHLVISDVDGSFNSFDVNLTSSKEDFTDATIAFSAAVSSIDTQNEGRDEHLQEPDFFNAKEFPTITFKSKSITPTEGNNYTLVGDLTMLDFTKEVSLDVELKGVTTNPFSKDQTIAGFKVKGTVKRSDFGIGKETAAAIVGDEVHIKANLAFSK